jgi:hypothetical protein
MSDKADWKWWTAQVSIPLATLILGVGGYYQQARNGARDEAKIRQEVEEILVPQIKTLEKRVKEQDQQIADLRTKAEPLKAPPTTALEPVPKIDFSKYKHLFPIEQQPAETYIDRGAGFLKDNWKYVSPFIVLSVIWLLSVLFGKK